MDTNQKKFGIYVFLSTFSRNLIEVYIPIILYKYGFNIKEIVFYYFMANIISLLLTYPFVYISHKFNNIILSAIGVIGFSLLQISLNFMTHSIWYLTIIALFFALYRRGYWISRRFYNLKVIKDKDISKTYSIISIINQIGVIISAYIGALMLDYISVKVLTAIALVLFAASIVSLYSLKFEHEGQENKLELRNTFKSIPKRYILTFGTYELVNIVKFLIPLYLFIYVKNTYQTIGIIQLVTNFSLILFTYLYGKKLDVSKKNFLVASIILTIVVYVLKINTVGYVLLIISFIEGIVAKMYELSVSKEFYTLSKKFDYTNYNLVYETTQNCFRSIVTILFVVFSFDLKTMVYITLAFISIGLFYNFKQGASNEKLWLCKRRF